MKNSYNQSDEIFKSLSEPKITKELSKEITNDALI